MTEVVGRNVWCQQRCLQLMTLPRTQAVCLTILPTFLDWKCPTIRIWVPCNFEQLYSNDASSILDSKFGHKNMPSTRQIIIFDQSPNRFQESARQKKG